ncbi:uncharacterized protein A1O5_08713 [Cladophialophora psammophila CBS 110553]|uniref:Uncharacterized protein n=1 Tax=Cladophialophora psammophila CBS 110553 TaxID=1182543 RepID=W9WJK2_9EURO|nr:uncharacterized protein A1O5_08713 [Cladophialophora psammophila CBS 110553]EXJ68098.1 hypothetical protein A1O5_08713 [Cladophialophora psammophila CBS 110553]
MSANFCLVLSISFLILSPQVFSPASATVEANVCAWDGAMPILYHEYGTDVCPPKFKMAPNGMDCEDNPNGGCASYCEMRTNFFYGQEKPYSSMPMCTGGLTCTLTESKHIGYNVKAKVNGNFKQGALTFGITGGWNTKTGQSQSYKYSKSLEHNECGYFTFIPILHESCGTYSEGSLIDGKCHHTQSIGNSCGTQAVTVEDHWYWFTRVVRGVAVFVYLDCTTLEPLPNDRQEAPFNQDGVRLPRGLPLANAFKTMWNVSRETNVTALSDAAVCDNDIRTYADDCLAAFTDVSDRGGDMVPTANALKGQSLTLSKSGTCAMHLSFDEDWKVPVFCEVSLLEVAAAAESIYELCTSSNDGTVGGSHVVRIPGNCGSTIKFLPVSG